MSLVLLRPARGENYVMLQAVGKAASLPGAVRHIDRSDVQALASTLIAPPAPIDFKSFNRPSEGKLSATVARPSAWYVGDKMILQQEYQRALDLLEPADRLAIRDWLGVARTGYQIGKKDAVEFVNDLRDTGLDNAAIKEAAEEVGGVKKRLKAPPLYSGKRYITRTGAAFMKLAALLDFEGVQAGAQDEDDAELVN